MASPERNSNDPDLRRTGSHPDHWYPVARSRELAAGRMAAVSFAGEPLVLVRPRGASVYALEDRCAHRQFPLHEGVVCDDSVRCGYHGWTYERSGQCVNIPYLGSGQTLPNGVRGYPCREEYGLIFVFPGDPAQAAAAPFPSVPAYADPAYKTHCLDRTINCHYSFMHENLLDMNHQFLHRSLMGGIRATLLDYKQGEDYVEAMYTFDRVAGSQSLGEKFMLGPRAGPGAKRDDIMTIRTQYPRQTLQFRRGNSESPVLDLWLSYVPVDNEQKINRTLGLMSIRKPAIPGVIHLFWPFIIYFVEGIFAQDHWAVELEQKAHDAQGGDWNREIFPVIRAVREVLLRCGKSRGG